MASNFMALALTPEVKAAQAKFFGRSMSQPNPSEADRLGGDEATFIEDRDSFYLASVNQGGWPYLQHRGGPKGFLNVLDERTLGFADLRGNRQLLSTGNVAGNDRVCLFLMSYPHQARLKIFGRAEVLQPASEPKLTRMLAQPGQERSVERLLRIKVEGYDWNCPQYITPRFSESEVQAAIQPLHDRIAELEQALARHSHS